MTRRLRRLLGMHVARHRLYINYDLQVLCRETIPDADEKARGIWR